MAVTTAGALAAGAIAAPVIGGIMGSQEAAKDRAAANRARAEALAQYAGISIPEAEDMMINIQQLQSQGQLSPEMEQALNLGPSAMEQISLDPKIREKQMQALEAMSGFATGQPTSADMAGFELARRGAASEMQAKSSQLMQEMAQRGQAGSGAELIARLQSQQSGADMLQQAQMQQAQAMQQARLAALQQQSGMAGQLRSQEYGEQSNLAQARDAIARMNMQNAQQIAQRNIASRNQAAAANLAERQRIADTNAQMLNAQQQYNKQLQQQEFQNRMALAGAKAGQYGGQAAAAQQQAGQTAGMWSTIGQGLGTGLAGAITPQAAKYDTKSGQLLQQYDPYTGKKIE